MRAWADIAGDPATGLLLIADHASNHVPERVALGVPDALLREHVAIDIGVAPLARRLCGMLGCPGILGAISRLVIDLNREEDAPGLIPEMSDGDAIAGNIGLSRRARTERIADYWRPYHAHIAAQMAASRPKLLISLHSFTPCLRHAGTPRPWEIGVLYNKDERAARRALPLVAAAGIVAGDNLPYSGKQLNATMNRHGEGTGTPYLGLEARQDLIDTPETIEIWAERLVPIIVAVAGGVKAP